MAVLNQNTGQTLIQLAKRSKNQEILPVAEVLDETTPMLMDAYWTPANGETTHTFTRRTSLPAGTYKKVNQGITAESSLVKQIVEPIAELKALSEIDDQLYQKAGNPTQYRQDEDRAFIEGMGQTFATDIIYGNNGTDPEKLNGLANRADWNALADANVTGSGGTGGGSVYSSLWIVQWGPMGASLAYPKNQDTGLDFMDHGRLRVTDSNNKAYFAWSSEFGMAAALCIKDVRSVQRLCNIAATGTGALDDDDIITMLNKMPQGGKGATIYVNRQVMGQLQVIAKDQTNIQYMPDQFGGLKVMHYNGYPVRLDEQILSTEAEIS